MNKTVVALYDDPTAVHDAIRELVENGFARDTISLMAREVLREYTHEAEHPNAESGESAQDAGIGAGIGAAVGGIGGLLTGLGMLAIPGIGPVMAAGPLVPALTLAGAGIGAVAGGVTGGFIGVLVDMGIPEERAEDYAEGVRRGGTLVFVKTTDQRASEAVAILDRHVPLNLDEEANQWQQAGWSGFNPNAESYQTEDANWPRGRYQTSLEAVQEEQAYSWKDDGSDEDDKRLYYYYEPIFRDHFSASVYDGEYTFDQFRPAYRYGYQLAMDKRYRDRKWDEVEPEVRQYWDEHELGTWEHFKDAVRCSWEEIRETVR